MSLGGSTGGGIHQGKGMGKWKGPEAEACPARSERQEDRVRSGAAVWRRVGRAVWALQMGFYSERDGF